MGRPGGRLVAGLTTACAVTGCPSQPSVLVKLQGEADDALVTINDRYVGKLGELRRRGIKLPPGTYRVTIEQVGYFPWDRLVEVGAEPLSVDVELVAIPD